MASYLKVSPVHPRPSLYLIAKYLFCEQHDRAIAKIWHKTMKKTPSLGSLRACEKRTESIYNKFIFSVC